MSTVERNPLANAATSSNQFPHYTVIVTGIDMSKASQPASDPRGIASTVDTFAKLRQIPVSMTVGSGAYPQVGETWVIDQSLGSWTFVSRQVPVIPEATDLASLAAGLDQLGIVNAPAEAFVPPSTPIGGAVYSAQFPSAVASFPSGLSNIWSANIHLVRGWQYAVTLTCIQCQQVTAASATAVQVYCRDSANYIPVATGIKAFIQTSMALNAYADGSQTIPITPTASGVDTFTVSIQTGASSLSISANGIALIITRIA
jgi:hypothetical protein